MRIGSVRRARAQLAAQVPAVGAGQRQIEQHQVPAGLGEGVPRGVAVGRAKDAEAGLRQVQADGVGDGVIVLDEQQLPVHTA